MPRAIKSKKELTLKNLEGFKIALLGFGLDNRALFTLLEKYKIKTDITICDKRPLSAIAPAKATYSKLNYQLGDSFNKNLDKFDLLFRAPGWPITCPGIQMALKQGHTDVSNPLNLFSFNLYKFFDDVCDYF